VNADLIAIGLSPLQPEDAAAAAGRLVLAELNRLARTRASFAFESTLSGIGYVSRLKKLKKAGYRIEIVYLKIDSTRLGLPRIAARVRQGGHNVPRADVLRRFKRSWENFERVSVLSQTAGRCTITRARRQSCSSVDHEEDSKATKARRFLEGRRALTSPRGQGGAENRAHARDADLHIQERESHSR
jgi:predicted ABC-type ATPase